MSSERWDKLKDVLDEVLETDPSIRPSVLDRLCAGDPALREEAERMAQEYEHMGAFLQGLGLPRSAEDSFPDGTLLASRFRILRRVGRGGMGAVYEAADMQLMGRRIALKTVRPDLAGSAAIRDRLKHEVLLAREISHPNVCPIYEFFETDGPAGTIYFFTMRLVEGETLREKIEREGALRPEVALMLARQIADGLDAAHAVGVIHRDFKPGNVVIETSQSGAKPVITDFGLARSTDMTDTVFAGVTHSIGIAGTPDYMAPEQFRTGPVTRAVDVYAFGTVLHEMVTGKRPNGVEGISKDLPPGWAPVIERCLVHDPAKRYGSFAELIKDLEHPSRIPKISRAAWLSIAAGLLALVAVGLGIGWYRANGPKVPLHVAVLPVASGGAEEDAALAEGVLDTVANDLSSVEDTRSNFIVVPASEVRQRKVQSVKDAVINFGVNRILVSTLRHEGTDLLLDMETRDGASSHALAKKTVRCPVSENFRLSEYASRTAADLLDVDLPSQARRGKEIGGTSNPEAYKEYVLARDVLRVRTAKTVEDGITHLQKALELDSQYGLAYGLLGEALASRFHFNRDVDALDLAVRQIERAATLANGSPAVRLNAAFVLSAKGDREAALKELRQAETLDPASLESLNTRGAIYSALSQDSEAERTFREVVRLRPHNWVGFNYLGEYFYRKLRYDEAEKMFRYVVEMAPQSVLGYNNLAAVEMVKENYPEAISLLQKSLSITESAQAYHNLGTAYFLQGKYREALPPMQKAVEMSQANPMRWRALGDVLARIPERQREARAAYGKAVELARELWSRSPQDTRYGTELALNLAYAGEKQQARETIAALDKLPEGDQNLLFMKALALEIAGERTRAIDLVDRLLRAGLSENQVRTAPELRDLRQDPEFARRERARTAAAQTTHAGKS